MKNTKYIFHLIIFLSIVAVLDRGTKIFFHAKNTLFHDTNRIIELVYACNPHSAFSIPIPWVLVYILCVGVFIIAIRTIISLFKKDDFSWIKTLPYILIIVGALSNCIDRIIHGCVIDFISVVWWPIFNLADSYIVIGVMWIVIEDVFMKKNK